MPVIKFRKSKIRHQNLSVKLNKNNFSYFRDEKAGAQASMKLPQLETAGYIMMRFL